MLLLQEFDIEIRDNKGAENAIVDHLSRLEREADLMPIQDEFVDEQILQMTHASPWYADICNYLIESTWVEARATKANDAKTIALISDQGSHFCNYTMAMLLEQYGVVH
ncbi:hypothetical protein CR513_44421, partial [Mucuna pruriens]